MESCRSRSLRNLLECCLKVIWAITVASHLVFAICEILSSLKFKTARKVNETWTNVLIVSLLQVARSSRKILTWKEFLHSLSVHIKFASHYQRWKVSQKRTKSSSGFCEFHYTKEKEINAKTWRRASLQTLSRYPTQPTTIRASDLKSNSTTVSLLIRQAKQFRRVTTQSASEPVHLTSKRQTNLIARSFSLRKTSISRRASIVFAATV